jgi:hypothetical protein
MKLVAMRKNAKNPMIAAMIASLEQGFGGSVQGMWTP